MPTTTLVIPGLHSSGPNHWQTWLEQQVADSVRVIQRDWKDANLPDWASRVRREISRNDGQIFIVAHSFGALAGVQAAFDHSDRIAGALLVAPADPEKFRIEEHLPAVALPFRTVIVASTNDPWIRFERALRLAEIWDADLINLGRAGHINPESGYGPWPEGLAILERLRESHAAVREAEQANRATANLEHSVLSSFDHARAGRVDRASIAARRALLRSHG